METQQLLEERLTTTSLVTLHTACGVSATTRASLVQGSVCFQAVQSRIPRRIKHFIKSSWKPTYYARALTLSTCMDPFVMMVEGTRVSAKEKKRASTRQASQDQETPAQSTTGATKAQLSRTSSAHNGKSEGKPQQDSLPPKEGKDANRSMVGQSSQPPSRTSSLSRKAEVNTGEQHLFYLAFSRESEMLEWFRLIASTLNIATIAPFMVDPSAVEVAKKLGGGSFGTVYRGTFNDTDVAIKKQKAFEGDGDTVAEFVNEAAMLASLRHDCLTSFHGLFLAEEEDRGIPFLNMVLLTELCEYGTLTKYLDVLATEPKDTKMKEGVRLMHSLFSGLFYLHEHRVIHRDLKPDNILLTKDHQLKICDFGQAKNISGSSGSRQMTANTRGSLLWRAPEMMTSVEAGNSITRITDYDTAVDIYAGGVIMWQLLYLDTPYKDIENTFDIELGVSNGTLRPPMDRFEQFPRVYNLVTSCWAQDPNERPCALAVAVRLEFEGLFSTLPVTDDEEDEVMELTKNQCRERKQMFSSEGDSRMMFHFAPEVSHPSASETTEYSEEDLIEIKRKLALIQREVDLFRTHSNAQISLAACVEAMRAPDTGILLATRKIFGTTSTRSFIGEQITTWLMTHMGMEKKRAVKAARIIKDSTCVDHAFYTTFKYSLKCYFVWAEGPEYRDGLLSLLKYI